MLHTFQEILVCSFAYIVLVAIAYKPRTTAPAIVEDEAQTIQYFPDIEEDDEVVAFENRDRQNDNDWTEEVTEEEIAAALATVTQPIVIVERRPVAAFTAPVATVPTVDLSALGVRDLYKLAADAKIKGYKKISKAKLIALLS